MFLLYLSSNDRHLRSIAWHGNLMKIRCAPGLMDFGFIRSGVQRAEKKQLPFRHLCDPEDCSDLGLKIALRGSEWRMIPAIRCCGICYSPRNNKRGSCVSHFPFPWIIIMLQIPSMFPCRVLLLGKNRGSCTFPVMGVIK